MGLDPGLKPATRPEHIEDPPNTTLHRAHAHTEFTGHRRVGRAGGQQREQQVVTIVEVRAGRVRFGRVGISRRRPLGSGMQWAWISRTNAAIPD